VYLFAVCISHEITLDLVSGCCTFYLHVVLYNTWRWKVQAQIEACECVNLANTGWFLDHLCPLHLINWLALFLGSGWVPGTVFLWAGLCRWWAV
jgi:hypothetical protein